MVIPDVVDWSFRGCRHLGLRWSCNAKIPYNTKLSTRYMKSWQQLNCVEVALYYCLRQFWVMVLGQNPGTLMSTSNKLVNGYMPPYIWNNPCPYVCLLVLKCLVDGIYTTLQIPPKKWWKSSNYDLKHHFKGYKRWHPNDGTPIPRIPQASHTGFPCLQDGSFDTVVDTFRICSFEQPVQVTKKGGGRWGDQRSHSCGFGIQELHTYLYIYRSIDW